MFFFKLFVAALFAQRAGAQCASEPELDLCDSSVATQITGSISLQVSDAASFVANGGMNSAVAAGIADTVAVETNMVEVTLSSSRRLVDEKQRLLAAGSVNVAYKITIPGTAPSTVATPRQVQNTLTAMATNPAARSALTSAISTKVNQVDSSQTVQVTNVVTPSMAAVPVSTNSTESTTTVSATTTDATVASGAEGFGSVQAMWMAVGLFGAIRSSPAMVTPAVLSISLPLMMRLAAASSTCADVKSFYNEQACCGKPTQALDFVGSVSPPSFACDGVPSGVCHCSKTKELLGKLPGVSFPDKFCEHMPYVKPVGWHSAPIPVSGDAGSNADLLKDGAPGNTAYPHGNLKVLATAGEVDPSTGAMLTGVPDGIGAYLKDATTVRLLYQSESYGQIRGGSRETFPWYANAGAASFTGSHIHFIDYDREKLSTYMEAGAPASAEGMVKLSGEAVEKVFNLRRQVVGARNGLAASTNYHDSNVNLAGEYIISAGVPTKASWLMQSLCSAHLEPKEQWGGGKGVMDDLFITNEEWIGYTSSAVGVIGLPVHVLNLATHELWATAAFTLGGHEKIVEVNSGHADYVAFVPSGYNGAFGMSTPNPTLTARNSLYNRTDGKPYVWPQNIVPTRLYVGKKGTNKDGAADTSDFLARNGFEYGALYGFAVDCSSTAFRDAWHATANAGDTVTGAFYKLRWQAKRGQVEAFEHDGSWEFQDAPDGAPDGWCWWTGAGPDASGKKTEHVSPDPRGNQRVVQGSTAGYFGVYDFSGLPSALGSSMPQSIPATYTCQQPSTSIKSMIELGGQGLKADGNFQDVFTDSGKTVERFEDIDGMEWIAAANNEDYYAIHEDGGNVFGERKFMAKIGTPLKYYFVAQSGGSQSSREIAGVSAVPNVFSSPNGHEFSGAFDLSGLLHKTSGNFDLGVGDTTGKKRQLDAQVPINDKIIALSLQAHSNYGGWVETFFSDRVAQVLAYRPNVPSA